MRVLVVHAHPLEESYSAALRDRAVRALEGDGHQVEVACVGDGCRPGPTAAALEGVEALVLVHPTWWGAQPAPLLAWIQETLGPFVDAPATSGPSPLRTVRHLVVVTTHGSARWINVLQGEPGRQLVRRVLLPSCAPGAELRWVALYKLDRLERRDLTAFLDRVEAEMASLTSEPAPA